MSRTIRLQDNLVLQHYLLDEFGKQDFNQLAAILRYTPEGYNEENISRFYLALTSQLDLFDNGFSERLLEYDRNIYRFTEEINFKRKKPIVWKYFQYLSLLFTEMYLDEYFRDRELLQNKLNKTLDSLRSAEQLGTEIPNYTIDNLNKIALWQATGSGKTLLMHMNILSLQHHMNKNERGHHFNKILLITPNEGLSEQHLQEFQDSNIPARRFDDSAQLNLLTSGSDSIIEVLEITKLKEVKGQKTIAVESFGQNNIVFVDEGHRGATGTDWKDKRDYLSAEGFAIEYSATFGQVVKVTNKATDKKQFAEYAKSIVFDYSYKYFYNDGYGKEFKILNLKQNVLDQHKFIYLVASLLTYYQQLKLYNLHKKKFQGFNLYEPLMVFVGSSVNAVRNEGGKNVSDVVDVLLFLNEFLEESDQSIDAIRSIIHGDSGLVDTKNSNIFDGAFIPLSEQFGHDNEAIYKDMLKLVFGSMSADGGLIVENLSGIDGEIALRVGTSDHFGLINVGDSSTLVKLCEENGLYTTDLQFSGSLFSEINEDHSPIKILIGSKKFTEGWNSWRVSTMGLLNLGRSEGSQVIQLFGRGVRLRGYKDSLKRSSKLYADNMEFRNLLPKYIKKNETLNIFGVRADYMETFRDYLEDEGVASEEDNCISIDFPTEHIAINHPLKTLGLRDDAPKFKHSVIVETSSIASPRAVIEIDLYPKLQGIDSVDSADRSGERNEQRLSESDIAFINRREVYFELEKYKNSKNWSNLNLDVDAILKKVLDDSWYIIYAPNMTFGNSNGNWSERRLVIQNDIVLPLAKKLLDRIYLQEKERHDSQYREYKILNQDDDNLIKNYTVKVDETRTDLIDEIISIKNDLASMQDDKPLTGAAGLLYYTKHLYKPLFYINQKSVDYIRISPVALNEGEEKFVRNLREYSRKHQHLFADKSLYLLRNLSRGKGVNFFEANNFYPDFILWIISGDKQHIAFVDPKGIYNMSEGKNSPKIGLSKEIKNIQAQLNDDKVTLDSFILAGTRQQSILWADNWGQNDFEENNIYFDYDDNHIEKMINKILGN